MLFCFLHIRIFRLLLFQAFLMLCCVTGGDWPGGVG